jgi:DUF305 family protein family protein
MESQTLGSHATMGLEMILVMVVLMVFVAYYVTDTIMLTRNKLDNLNKFYMGVFMALVMVTLEILVMAFPATLVAWITLSIIIVAAIFMAYIIRRQIGITPKQYLAGMIPHHEMAIVMSQQLLEKPDVPDDIATLAKNIIRTQTEEINQMKAWLKRC